MNIKRFIILNILSIFILTGCKNTKDINYNSDIKVNGPSLKISLIQTAYEIYTTNIENLSNNSTYEDLYNNTSRDAKKHYTFHFFTTFAIYFNINIRELEKLVHQHPLTVIYYYVKNSCVLTLIALKIGI